MRAIVAGRQMGKTSQLIEWFIDDPESVIVCHNQEEADRLAHRILAFDSSLELKDIRNRIHAFGFASRSLRGRQGKIYVDNVDILLRNLFGPNVEGFSATGELYD